MESKIKKIIAILLLFCFVVSITATSVSATIAASEKDPRGLSVSGKKLTFKDTSSGVKPTKWGWNFGDGKTVSNLNIWVGSGGYANAKNIEKATDGSLDKVEIIPQGPMGPTPFPS